MWRQWGHVVRARAERRHGRPGVRGAALLALLGLALAGLLAGCGSAASGTVASFGPAHSASGSDQSGSYGPAATPISGSASASPNTYLIKSLQADLAVPDPRKTASDLSAWITSTDPRAQSAGVDYSRQDDGTYSVQMTYSVQAALYPKVQAYLADYTSGHDGRLLHLHENIQDVTGQYVDLQSQLTNLRAEQQRLLDLMAHSSNLSDTIAIEDRLSQVEGQINQIEGRQNALNGQTSFYTVTINLTPLSALTGQPPTNPAWNAGDVLRQAWGAAVVFGEFLASAAIWLGVFCIYALPAVALGWLIALLVRRFRARVRSAA